MGRAVIGEVTGRAVALGLAILVAALDLGFYAVMLAAGAGSLVVLLVTWALTRPVAAVRFHADRAVWRLLLVASLPLGLALAINELYFRADTLIISLFEPFEQVGPYTLAYRMLEFALALGSIFLTTVFPLLSEAVAHDEPRALRLIQSSTDALVLLGAPLVAGGLVVAPQLVELVERRGLRRRRHAAADPARGRGAVLGQRRLRLRARGQAPAARARCGSTSRRSPSTWG